MKILRRYKTLIAVGAVLCLLYIITFEIHQLSRSLYSSLEQRPLNPKPTFRTKSDLHHLIITTKRPVPPPPPRLGCANSADIVKTFDKKSKTGIPLIIHQVYKDTNLPKQYFPFLRDCRRVNKEFLYILWTDADFEKFLATRPANVQSLYKNYKSPEQRSDFIRLVILEHFGGVYMDLDVQCLKPLVQTLDTLGKTCILDRERELQTRMAHNRDFAAMNSVMIATPGHKFIRYLLQKLSGSLQITNVIWRTGPLFVTDRYLEYIRTARNHSDAVYLAPARLFSPLIDPINLGSFNKKCVGYLKQKSSIRRAACEEWIRQGRKQDEAMTIANSTLVHRFMHLVYTYMAGHIKVRFDACLEVEGVTRYIV